MSEAMTEPSISNSPSEAGTVDDSNAPVVKPSTEADGGQDKKLSIIRRRVPGSRRKKVSTSSQTTKTNARIPLPQPIKPFVTSKKRVVEEEPKLGETNKLPLNCLAPAGANSLEDTRQKFNKKIQRRLAGLQRATESGNSVDTAYVGSFDKSF